MGWIFEDTSIYRGKSINEFVNVHYKDIDWVSKPAIKLCEDGKTYYRAFKTEKGKISCAIILIQLDRYEIGYKFMTEDVCPVECDCPISILKLLDPTDNENAKKWREKCNNKILRNKKLKDGTIIKFKYTESFTNGMGADTFKVVVVKPPRGNSVKILKAIPSKGQSYFKPFNVYIKNWRRLDFDIIKE